MLLPKTSTANRGSIFLELLLAYALFSIMLVGFVSASTSISEATTNSIMRRELLYKTADFLKQQNVSQNSLGISTFALTKDSTTSISTLYITPCIQFITATTTWQSFGSTHTITLSQLFSDPTVFNNLGKDCGRVPLQAGNQVFTVIQNIASSTLSDVDIYNHIAYVSAATATSEPDIFVEDISNPNQLSSLYTISGQGIARLDAASSSLFVGFATSTTQIGIYSLQDALHPQQISTTSLPNVAGSYPGALSILYYDNKLYVGTHRTAGNEFHIFDVSSIVHPKWLGSIELNHNINDIQIAGNYAYLGTSGNTKNIIILDIHDPAHIKELGSLIFPGTEDTTRIAYIGSYIFAGRVTSTQHHDEFLAISVASSTNPTIISSIALHDSVKGIRLANNIAYVITTHTLTKIDLNFLPILKIISTQTLNYQPLGIDYEDKTLVIPGEHTISITNM